MAPISEIEKLERRWNENRQGLTFAPLAEAYRKSGDVARALEVLQEGLERYPDYIPASIVLGRCHLDTGDDPAAERAFMHVLALDAENVIALKALADITERTDRPEEAVRWLDLLLAVDRSNEDAREQLARLSSRSAGTPDAAAAPSAEPAPPAESAPAAPRTFAAAMEAAIDEGTDEYPIPSGAASSSEAEPELAPEAELPFVAEPEFEPVAAPELAIEPAPEIAPEIEPEPVALEREDLEPLPATDALGEPADEAAHEGIAPDFEYGEFTPPGEVARDPSIAVEEPLELESDVAPMEGLVGAGSDVGTSAVESLVEHFESPLSPTEPMEESAGRGEQGAPADEDLGIEQHGEVVLEAGSAPLFPRYDAAEELKVELPELELAAAEETALGEASLEASTAEAQPVEEPAVGEPAAEPAHEVELPALETSPDHDLGMAHVPYAEPTSAESEPFAPELVGPEAGTPGPVEPGEATAGETIEPVEVEEEDEAAALTGDQLPAVPLVVTESMAELYLRQGHRSEALRVYRELAERRPGDDRLSARVAELEATERAATAAETAGRSAARPAYAAAATGGESVGDFFRALLAERLAPAAGPTVAPTAPESKPEPAPAPFMPAPAEAASGAGAPTRPAADPLSLSAVFGEEGAGAGSGAPPSAPAGGVSFDEFFGAPAPEPADATRVARPSKPVKVQDDDLDQFNAWLQNLKR
ncbi:MAG TPA: tetratricopeptide repeat protein [Gemmatimonadales bacterium]|nr:tetratricopeptide repeat protein [Gemmatimonadales bacterium]